MHSGNNHILLSVITIKLTIKYFGIKEILPEDVAIPENIRMDISFIIDVSSMLALRTQLVFHHKG